MGLLAHVTAGTGVVQLTIEAGTVPSGEPWELTGQVAGTSWQVRGGKGVSDGSQVVLADALAPLNIESVYRLTWASGAASVSTRRPYSGRSLVSDLLGGSQVDCLWQGTDARTVDRRVTEHVVAGRSTPVIVMAPVMGAGTRSPVLRTSGDATRVMRDLVTRPVAVALFHNPERCFQCRTGTCDVDLVTVMVLTDVSEERTRRADAAERTWTLKGTVVDVPELTTVLPSSTWSDLDAAALTWAELDAMALTWDAADRTIWQEVSS